MNHDRDPARYDPIFQQFIAAGPGAPQLQGDLMLVHHHKKYFEFHGVDETIVMEAGDHKRLHARLRREGLCNIPSDELEKISARARRRRLCNRTGDEQYMFIAWQKFRWFELLNRESVDVG